MSTRFRLAAAAHPSSTFGRTPDRFVRSAVLTSIFSFGVATCSAWVHSADSESALQRSVVERNQQSEALSNRTRQTQQLFDAQSRGASPQQLRELEARHLRQRVEQDAQNSRQLSELDRLGAQPQSRSPGALEAETLRGERDRALNRRRAADDVLITPPPSPAPTWTPTLQKRER